MKNGAAEFRSVINPGSPCPARPALGQEQNDPPRWHRPAWPGRPARLDCLPRSLCLRPGAQDEVQAEQRRLEPVSRTPGHLHLQVHTGDWCACGDGGAEVELKEGADSAFNLSRSRTRNEKRVTASAVLRNHLKQGGISGRIQRHRVSPSGVRE